MDHTIILTLPEHLYEQLAARAQTAARSVEDVATQTLAQSLPPSAEPNLPPQVQAELKAMEHLSDEALWAIARSTANDDKIALYDLLIERQNAHMLTAEGRHLLAQLRDEADALSLRKAHAYRLLHSRGHTLPTLDELHTQTP
jgi:hypothetical protein